MRNSQFALSLLGIATPLLGCSSSMHDQPQPDAGQRLSSPTSFNVAGALALLTDPGNTTPQFVGPPPTQPDFVLRVDPASHTALIGSHQYDVTTSDGVAFAVTGAVSMTLAGAPCGGFTIYNSFRFTARPDGVSGVADGMATVFVSDYGNIYAAHLDFQGMPDHTGPALLGGGTAVDPLVPLSLSPSEPLPAESVARLVASNQVVDLVPDAGNPSNTVIAFHTPAVALRYATSYTVVVDPWTDLAGNAGAPLDTITTAPAPPLLPEDGFEGDATAALLGALVVDASVVPPIDGQRSIVLQGFNTSFLPSPPPNIGGPRLRARLAVNPGDGFVRFSLRTLWFSSTLGSYNTSFRVAAPGGEVARFDLPADVGPRVPVTLPSGTAASLGEIHAIEVPLPAGTVDEVVVDFRSQAVLSGCGLPPPPSASYLIDDLRVE